jgi:hypothetical protein
MQALTRPHPALIRASPSNARCTNQSLNQRRPSFRPTSTAVNEAVTTTSESSSSSGDVELVGPTPQRFVVADGQLKEIATTAFITMLRAGAGALASGYKISFVRGTPENQNKYTLAGGLPGGFRLEESSTAANYRRPTEPLTIIDAQDANSRKIREAVCILDMDTIFKPCAEGGMTLKNNSKTADQIPYMIDPNNGTEMTDADEIVAYLFRNYGDNKIPLILRKGPINDLTAKVGMAPRKDKGTTYTGSKRPEQPLEYWAYEASPFCAVVREVLSELEIPHLMKTVARGSTKREELFAKRGHFQAPYLEDPNTGVAMFESTAIIEYLYKTYGNESS